MKSMRLALATGLVLSLSSPTTMALTLYQFWQETLAHDPRIRAYRQQLEAASQEQPLALSALLPHVTAQAGEEWDSHAMHQPYPLYSRNRVILSSDTRYNITSWSVQIKQALFNWSALQEYRASGDQVAVAAAQYQQSLQGLERGAIVAYVQWLQAYANLQSLTASEQDIARQAFAAEARYRSGTTGILGADETKVALGQVRAQIANATTQWEADGAKLEQFTGKKPPLKAPTLPRVIELPSRSLPAWKAQALTHNPALAAARFQLAASRKGVKAAQGGFLPTLSLVLAHQWQSDNGTLSYRYGVTSANGIPNSLGSLGTSAALQLNWPIFSGGAQQASLNRAQYQEEESFSTLAATQRSIEQNLRSSYAALSGSLREATSYRDSLVLAERASTAADDGVRVGLVSENNAIVDRKNVLLVRNGLNNANASTIIQFTNLAYAAGVLTPTLLRHISTSLRGR
ncbi:TolC family protein [Acidithiobacillus sulfuriphilus]|uniref:TolC family protein n=1 Tax=Acidithiobacillus sulfuriphilus TaxID=1867749 RepID=UPI003F646B6D